MATTEFPTTFAPEMQIITPEMGLGEDIDAELHSLMNRGIVVGHGLTEHLADSLAESSTQPHIIEFCASQPTRFGDRQLAEKWQGKGRMMVSFNQIEGYENQPLTTADLLAVSEEELRDVAHGWAGGEKNKHIPDADVTTAYRVVERGLRQGFAKPLAKMVVGLTTALYGVDPEQVSLETWKSNNYAVHTYLSSGFTQVATTPDVRPTLQKQGTKINGQEVFSVTKNGVTTYKVPDVRLFMRNDPNGRFVVAA